MVRPPFIGGQGFGAMLEDSLRGPGHGILGGHAAFLGGAAER